MTNEQYKIEVDKRGGRKAVAAALGLSLSVIDRRCNGDTAKIKTEAERSLLALPVREGWRTLARLKVHAAFRANYRAAIERLPAGVERTFREALLAEAEACLPGNRNFGKEAAKGGHAKAKAMRKAARTKGKAAEK